MVFDAMIDISLITLGLAIISQIIQAKFLDKEKMKKQQEGMKEKQAKMKELMAKQDQKSANEIETLQKEIMGDLSETMQGSFKVMKASMFVFLPAFFLMGGLYIKEIDLMIYEGLFKTAVIDLPIPLPWFGEAGIQLFNQTNWFGWYFVTYLLAQIIIGAILKVTKFNLRGVVNGR